MGMSWAETWQGPGYEYLHACDAGQLFVDLLQEWLGFGAPKTHRLVLELGCFRKQALDWKGFWRVIFRLGEPYPGGRGLNAHPL